MTRTLVAGALALVLGVVSMGCSSLRVTQYQYKGDLSHSYRSRLVEGRGKANQALARIESNDRLRRYFLEQPEGRLDYTRTPAELVNTINSILGQETGTLAGGLPQPHDSVACETSEEVKKRQQDNQVIRRMLDIVGKDLRELGTILSAIRVNDVEQIPILDQQGYVVSMTTEEREGLEWAVADLQRIGREIVGHTEFPDFSEVVAEEDAWVKINPVETFGGFGKSEFVVYMDETGNYQRKSAVFDPSDVARAAQKATMSLVKTIAGAYGVPAPSASGSTTTAQAQSAPVMELETKKLKEQLALIRKENAALQGRLEVIRSEVANNTMLPDVAAGRVRDELVDYGKKIEAIEQSK